MIFQAIVNLLPRNAKHTPSLPRIHHYSEMQHPKRRRGDPMWAWVDECVHADECRYTFIREQMKNTMFSPDEMESIQLCVSYHEHCNYTNVQASLEFLSLVGPEFQSRRDNCYACCESSVINQGAVVVADTETTGLSKEDDVIQLGFVVYDEHGKELYVYERIWQTDRKSHSRAYGVHGIPDDVVKSSPYTPSVESLHFCDVLTRIRANDGVFVAHNAKFDMRMIQQTMSRTGSKGAVQWPRVFCTLLAVKQLDEKARGKDCKNEQVYTFWGGPLIHGRAHTALVDLRMTAFIYKTGCDAGRW